MDNIRIVEQCKSGDREAFGLLYQAYLPSMREVVAYYVHNSDIVWDILHDGFLIAFTSIGTLNNGAKVEAWLTTIMKNLSLQYLKGASSHTSIPISDIANADNVNDAVDVECELTWDELNCIIGRLPDGYGNVFRLAVLDGLSHKEIGALLGIAPHSSSSQLARAKTLLRRMIIQYRVEMGILSIVAMILIVWHGIFNHREEHSPTTIITKNTGNGIPTVTDSVIDGDIRYDSIIPKSNIIYNMPHNSQIEEHIAVSTVPKDSVTKIDNDSVVNDTIRLMPNIIDKNGLVAQEDLPHTLHTSISDWSLSLAYSGNLGKNELNQYSIPDPELPSGGDPDGEIEVTEKTHHHMPVVIGLALNKTITSRWSLETGIRYSFLRSDFLSESRLMKKETIQRIHYIGVPLKFNYRMFKYSGFTLYGQGGVALDIPVQGRHSVIEVTPEWMIPKTDKYRIDAPLQWSVEGGLGIQYHFTPSFSIYAEPSFRYYFDTGSDIETIRQEKPIEFSIPIGLRLTW